MKKLAWSDFVSDVTEPELIQYLKERRLYAKGTSDRDISDVINEIYGFTLSHETIPNIVDRVQPCVIEWQNRRLDKVYPFVCMDALMAEHLRRLHQRPAAKNSRLCHS